MMNQKELKARILEFTRVHTNAGDSEIALLEAALFIEDEFGLVLTDDEICEKNLGTRQAIEKFVSEKLHSSGSCAVSVE